jgi:hypothetical protein
MSRWLLPVIIIICVAGAAWYLLQPASAPAISIAAPAAGAAWQAGEAHTISWATIGIPTTDKISITIRRIPPPPLPEEGQEFDPVVFTNLPNTGSVEWKISPMYPTGTYVLGVSAYKSVPVTNPISAESAPFTLSHPALSPALYPLYSPADWSAPEVESSTIGSTTYSGASVTSAAIEAGADPGSVFAPFQRYYDKRLKAAGWQVANDLAAGGHTGGQSGYRKGSAIILTSFHIEYQSKPASAPSECPCAVTLSLFSSAL